MGALSSVPTLFFRLSHEITTQRDRAVSDGQVRFEHGGAIKQRMTLITWQAVGEPEGVLSEIKVNNRNN